MPALQWLREKVHFHLPEQDVKAIRDFALLYSFFEAKALNEDQARLGLLPRSTPGRCKARWTLHASKYPLLNSSIDISATARKGRLSRAACRRRVALEVYGNRYGSSVG
ncbi:MAG: hypothetical protein EKK41_08940 [Hyphomicrobiales bacterium]|nr:MAG: hypothetical protein EKK41_08940 [Hyphomicrobiales bacterium]